MSSQTRPVPDSRAQVRSWLDAISGIARQVNEQAPLGQVLDRIAAMTCELAGYDFSAVLTPNPEGTALIIRGSSGVTPEYVTEVNERRPLRLGPTAMGEAPSSRAYHNRRPVALRDIWVDSTCAPWEAVAHDQGNRSLLSLPLLGSTGAVGVLNCYMREPRDFSPEDIVFMETIADQAALAVESATLRASERDTIERLHAVNQELSEQQTLLHRIEQAQRDLMRVVLEERGLGGLASSASELLGGEVIIEAPDATLLAHSGEQVPEQLATARERVEFEEWDDVAEGGEASAVVAVPDPSGGQGAAVVPVYLEHGLVARVWLFGSGTTNGWMFESRVLDAASMVTALVMSRDQISQEVQWRVARELVDELLWRGDRLVPEAATARGRQLGLELSEPHVLVVVRSPDCRHWDPDDLRAWSLLSRLQSVVKEHGTGAAVPGREGESILLWPVEGSPSAESLMSQSLPAVTPEGCRPVNVAVSTECHRLAEYPGAYESARQALLLAESDDRDGQLIDIRRLGLHRVLLNAARPHELASFADDLLHPLENYDQKRDGTLVPTLQAYFARSCSATRTAEALGVHTNTVRYRLRRVAELLEVDLEDENERLGLSLALMVRNVMRPIEG